MYFLTENKQSKKTIFTIKFIPCVKISTRRKSWLVGEYRCWPMNDESEMFDLIRQKKSCYYASRSAGTCSWIERKEHDVYRRATWYLIAIRLAFSMEITYNFLLAWKTVQWHSFIRYVYNELKNAFDFRRQAFRNWYSLTVNNHFHWIVDLFFIACRHLMNYENYRF